MRPDSTNGSVSGPDHPASEMVICPSYGFPVMAELDVTDQGLFEYQRGRASSALRNRISEPSEVLMTLQPHVEESPPVTSVALTSPPDLLDIGTPDQDLPLVRHLDQDSVKMTAFPVMTGRSDHQPLVLSPSMTFPSIFPPYLHISTPACFPTSTQSPLLPFQNLESGSDVCHHERIWALQSILRGSTQGLQSFEPSRVPVSPMGLAGSTPVIDSSSLYQAPPQSLDAKNTVLFTSLMADPTLLPSPKLPEDMDPREHLVQSMVWAYPEIFHEKTGVSVCGGKGYWYDHGLSSVPTALATPLGQLGLDGAETHHSGRAHQTQDSPKPKRIAVAHTFQRPQWSSNPPNCSSRAKPKLKQVTDSAHYRPRNAFFMFRGFVSRLQSVAQPMVEVGKEKDTSLFETRLLTRTPPNPRNGNSNPRVRIRTSAKQHHPLTNSVVPRRPGLIQTKISVSCGQIWSSDCLVHCGADGCANCRMRSLFEQASNYMKLRQAEIERRIESLASANTIQTENPVDMLEPDMACEMDSRERTADYQIEDKPIELSFNWNEFVQLYQESDLFRWHHEVSDTQSLQDERSQGWPRRRWGGLDRNGVLDIAEMKRIWIEKELTYERAFVEGAKKRIAQDALRATYRNQMGRKKE
ncbi:hypothetical protein BGW38_002579 [Lunasporangiospora selenospora]|uniref:Uncharacterized protein n=1 Tax=Lunasporangiospora selenospora TaxID=979761 RepID=A0A9P6FRV6_9FUNG|nr:hypothetical protein BGW38_002579 [Lunasporangiospora selenospora]